MTTETRDFPGKKACKRAPLAETVITSTSSPNFIVSLNRQPKSANEVEMTEAVKVKDSQLANVACAEKLMTTPTGLIVLTSNSNSTVQAGPTAATQPV